MINRCESQEYQMAAAQTGNSMAQYAITDSLVLAGQPNPKDWACLAKNGFDTILNIRQDPQKAAVQAKLAEAVGLKYIHLPLPAYELDPEHVAQFNQVIGNPKNGKILFHCRSASRTGLLWLLKRTEHDGWTLDQAEAELRAAGYDDDNIGVFEFCADDYFERTLAPELQLAAPLS